MELTLAPKSEYDKKTGASKTLSGWEYAPDLESEFKEWAEHDRPYKVVEEKPLRF